MEILQIIISQNDQIPPEMLKDRLEKLFVDSEIEPDAKKNPWGIIRNHQWNGGIAFVE